MKKYKTLICRDGITKREVKEFSDMKKPSYVYSTPQHSLYISRYQDIHLDILYFLLSIKMLSFSSSLLYMEEESESEKSNTQI